MGNRQSACTNPDAVVTSAAVVNPTIDVNVLNQMFRYNMWTVKDLDSKQTKAFFKRWTDGYLKDWNEYFGPMNDQDIKEHMSDKFDALRLPPKSPHEKNIRMYSHCRSGCHAFKTFIVVVVELQGTKVAYIIRDRYYSYVESSSITPPAQDPEGCAKAKPSLGSPWDD